MECKNCELRQRQNEHVTRASRAFKSIESGRLLRAEIARADHSLDQSESQELFVLSQTIARARSGIVQELVKVFHVVKVGGRPAVGGWPGARGEWTVGGLVLPVPGDVRRYPPDHINAVITHTIHFLGLLTFYLGIKLPFEDRWTAKHPLHLTSNPSSTPSSSPSPTLPVSLADSEALEQVPAHVQNQSFTTGLAMLLYNVCYLAHSQGVEIPLSQACDAFGELGRRSHSTNPLLLPPTPPSFTLDFAQALQATAASPS
ncbi:UV radiation resistance protein and autophagy-related subunit 14-domain-containing protein [Suillus variegatus]|nr:UV radiation resistance protein and autophagy-related subunit 14-domain-containing protein [Suillus variegatus]